MKFLGLLFFIVALNMDAMSVGISYGIRRIAIPVYSMLIVCTFSFAAISLSMGMGHVLAHTVSASTARHFGGGILLILGLSALYQYYKSASSSKYITSNLSRSLKARCCKASTILGRKLDSNIMLI